MSGLVDTDAELWEFKLPTLCTFQVAKDGSAELALVAGVDAQGEAMVRNHLIDPRVWWRRGYWLLNGAVVVDPNGRAVLISSAPELAERVIIGLAKRGWSCVGDFLVPARVVDGAVLVYPRAAPIVCSAAIAVMESMEIDQFVRPGGNAVGVVVKRWQEPIALTSMATLLPEPPEPVSPGIGRARIARGLLIEVAAKERTPRELLEIVSGLAVLPAWVSSDPLRAITDQDAEWASADAHQTSTKAKEALDVALDELAGWVSAGHG